MAGTSTAEPVNGDSLNWKQGGGRFSLGFRHDSESSESRYIEDDVPVEKKPESENIVPADFPLVKFTQNSGLIHSGTVPLNKVTRFLKGFIPDKATAELLWAPENLADIDGKGRATWADTFDRTADVKGYNSMPRSLFFKQDTLYEKLLTNTILIAFRNASLYKQDLRVGLFIPTDPLLCGREPDSKIEVIKNNLYATQDEVAKQGKPLVTGGCGLSNWFLSASQDTEGYARAVNLARDISSDGSRSHVIPKNNIKVETRLAALVVHPL